MTERLAQVVDHFSHCMTVIRRDVGEYIEGRYRQGEPRRFDARGSVQPARDDEIALLPEGTRSDGAVSIWSDCDLKIGSTKDQEPDHVLFRGVEYEIKAEADWFHFGSYRRYIAIKAGQ